MNEKPKRKKSSRPPSIFILFLRELRHDWLAAFGLFFLAIMFLVIYIGAPIIESRHDVMWVSAQRIPVSPAEMRERIDAGELEPQVAIFGMDRNGRNQFNLLFVAARNSLNIGLGVTFFSFVIGIAVGVLSGFYGGRADNIIMRFCDTWSMIPFLMIVIVLLTIFPSTPATFILFLTLFSWVGRARLLRAAALSQRQLDYISASKTLGTRNLVIIVREMLPNLVDVAVPNFVLTLAGSIGIETGLSLLGYGLGIGHPSLGTMMQNAVQPLYLQHFWFVWAPALVLMLSMMLCVNFVGGALQRVSDPKQRFA